MSDPNLELLATVHNIQFASQNVVSTLNDLIAVTTSSEYVPVTVMNAEGISSLITLQSKIIAILMEQNQSIYDRIEATITRISE